MNSHNGLHASEVGLLLFVLLCALYVSAVICTNRLYRKWPVYRTICWLVGVLSATFTVFGPLANLAHHHFVAHMFSHLLLGMLAPLIIAISAPITLLLRTLNTQVARKLSKVLRSGASRLLTDPIIATTLNLGGLWLLYMTDLYVLMHENRLVYLLVHVHIFIAGYLFTISLIHVETMLHQNPFLYRAIVLIIALAGHGILAKYMYAHPPKGVLLEQAEQASLVMYYGGDIIDAILIFIFCFQWFRAVRPRRIVRS